MTKHKTIFFCLVINFFGSGLAGAQTAKALTPGIYKSFGEYRQGIPSMPLNDSFYIRKTKYGFWGLTSHHSVTYQRLETSRNAARKMGKVFGFSDGRNFYVRTGHGRFLKRSNFAQAESIGPYLFYQDLDYIFVSHLPLIWWSLPAPKLVVKETGRFTRLTPNLLKAVLAGNPGMLQNFKNEKHKYRKLKEYLAAYYNS